MKKKIWIGIGITVLLAVLITVGVMRAQSTEEIMVETATIQEQELTGTVMIPGTLQLANEQKVFVDAQNGEIKEIFVKEGDTVEKGSPLLKYENEQLQLEKEQNQLTIESNYIRINQINDQLEDLDDKEKELEKQVGKEEAKKQVESERKQLETEKKMADLELRQNLLQKETIAKRLSELEVKSEIDGIVISVDEDAKNSIDPKVLIHIGSLKELKVTGAISEYDTLKIVENQPVTLTTDVLPDEKWSGTVSYISTLPEQMDAMTQSGAVQYPIEVTVTDDNIKAKPGFKMIMEIETERKTAQVIPVDAIIREDEGHFVWVVEGNKATKKEITVGSANGDMMEVKSGLTKEDQVIVNPSDKLMPGVEVTVQ